jgi:hypothetical protein
VLVLLGILSQTLETGSEAWQIISFVFQVTELDMETRNSEADVQINPQKIGRILALLGLWRAFWAPIRLKEGLRDLILTILLQSHLAGVIKCNAAMRWSS